MSIVEPGEVWPSFVRNLNHSRLLLAIRDNGPISRPALAQQLRMSKVTVSSIANDLQKANLVHEAGTSEKGLGRRAVLLDLNSQIGFLAAVDIDADIFCIRLADMRGRLLSKAELETPRTLASLVSMLRSHLAEMVVRWDKRLEDVVNLHVAVPASINSQNTIQLVGEPGYLGGDEFFRLLRASLPTVDVRLVNDMNAATIGEHAFGTAQSWKNFAYLGIRRSGVGMGLFLSGGAYLGANGRAGEIGLLKSRHEQSVLESFFDGPSPDAHNELAKVVAIAFTLLDLEAVVVHTELEQGPHWLSELRAHLNAAVPYPSVVVASDLAGEAPIRGAAVLAKEAAWSTVTDLASVVGERTEPVDRGVAWWSAP